MDLWDGKARPAAPIETFASFQAGFLPLEGFHRISCIFMDSPLFTWIYMDFGHGFLGR
jgi:hypothetical protein